MINARVSERFELREYITAFVDLLGMGERLRAFDRLSHDRSSETSESILNTARSLYLFRDVFRSYYESPEMSRPRTTPGPLTSKQRVEWDRVFEIKAPILQSFADSVIVSVPVELDPIQRFHLTFLRLIMGCSMASQVALVRGTPTRGGIAIGYGGEVFEGEVLSASQVKAHELESKEAVHPRIVLHPELLTSLVPPDQKPDEWTESDHARAKGMWVTTVKWLRSDRDGYVFLDFLGEAALSLIQPVEPNSTLSVEAFDTAIQDGIINSKRRRDVAKWRWLESYWRDCRPSWLEAQGEL